MMSSFLRRVATEWKLHLIVLGIVLVAEFVYVREVELGPVMIILIPLLYAFVIGALINPNVVGRSVGWLVRSREVRAAAPYINIAVLILIAKLGTLSGSSIEAILSVGLALILQEIGNLATVLLAFPIGLLVLRLGREIIGASHSVAREPSLAIIFERYGPKSKESTGVIGAYVCGTLFGTIIFSLLASVTASLGIFNPLALAMACGMGSASMFAACSASLVPFFPEMEQQILAVGAASNALTSVTGVYAIIFIALPLCEFLYKRLGRRESTVEGGEA